MTSRRPTSSDLPGTAFATGLSRHDDPETIQARARTRTAADAGAATGADARTSADKSVSSADAGSIALTQEGAAQRKARDAPWLEQVR